MPPPTADLAPWAHQSTPNFSKAPLRGAGILLSRGRAKIKLARTRKKWVRTRVRTSCSPSRQCDVGALTKHLAKKSIAPLRSAGGLLSPRSARAWKHGVENAVRTRDKRFFPHFSRSERRGFRRRVVFAPGPSEIVHLFFPKPRYAGARVLSIWGRP